jgi:hypothetical protein
MTHWKKLMDPKDWLFAFDLEGRDVTVTITHVVGGELTGEHNKKSKKPVAHLKGTKKKLALNVTNCKTIQQLTGTGEVEEWKDLRVTLFPTTTNFGGDTVDCIRIRPMHPAPVDSKSGNNKRNGSSRAEQREPATAGAELTDAIADKMREQGATVPRDPDADEDESTTDDIEGADAQ